MNQFNNRELATAIWLLLFIIFVMFKEDVRKSSLNVLEAFLRIKILSSIVLIAAYTAGIVFLLSRINLWNTSLLKDTIIWLGLTGIVLASSFVTANTTDGLFKKTILDNLKILMIVEFIINTYTFSLLVEIFFVPFVAIVVILNTFSGTDDKYSSFTKLSAGLLTIIGIIILVLTVISISSDYKNFGTLDTLRSFLLPPLLTFLFLPFLYLLVLYSNYEHLFTRLDLGYDKSHTLKRYAKKEIIKHCLFSLKKTNAARNMGIYDLMSIKTKEDVEELVRVYKNKV